MLLREKPKQSLGFGNNWLRINRICLYRLFSPEFLNSGNKEGSFNSPTSPHWSKEGIFHRGNLFSAFSERKEAQHAFPELLSKLLQFKIINMSLWDIWGLLALGPNSILWNRSFLVWYTSTYLYLILLPLILMSNTNIYCKDQCQRAYLLCFLLGVLWFQALCLSMNRFWVDFFIWCEIRVQSHSFAHGYPVKRQSFPHCVLLAPFL